MCLNRPKPCLILQDNNRYSMCSVFQLNLPPTEQHTAKKKKKQKGLTEPGGVTHFSLISPLTLLVLQVRERLSPRIRITLLGACISITGGATGTERKSKQTWLDFQGALPCMHTNAFSPLYLVWPSGSSHAIWRTLPWVFLCTHSSLRRPFVCCGWWCLAPGLQKTGDQRPELHWNTFPGAGGPDLDRLPGRGWKQCLPHDSGCWKPSIFWKDCRDLARKMQSRIKAGVRAASGAACWVCEALLYDSHITTLNFSPYFPTKILLFWLLAAWFMWIASFFITVRSWITKI